jgi:hypothetical protein
MGARSAHRPQTRPLDDIDVIILCQDQPSLATFFAGWELWIAADGRLRSWDRSTPLVLGDNGLWCRQAPTRGWQMEVVLPESDGDDWGLSP